MEELYEILEVSENATEKEIKMAYRRLAKKYHPDTCNTPGSEEMFKKINAANEILSDKYKREQYDNERRFKFEQTFTYDSGFYEYEPEPEMDLDEIVMIIIFLETAVNGGKVTVKGHNLIIPPNIGQDMKLRIKNAGRTYNGRTGDLYVQVDIQGDNIYELEGNNIHTNLLINIEEAIFGCHKEINFYGEKINVKIPKDIKYGQKLRVKGKGLKGEDLYIHLKYELPNSSDIDEELLKNLLKGERYENRKK